LKTEKQTIKTRVPRTEIAKTFLKLSFRLPNTTMPARQKIIDKTAKIGAKGTVEKTDQLTPDDRSNFPTLSAAIEQLKYGTTKMSYKKPSSSK
jgi:hypothetical protein